MLQKRMKREAHDRSLRLKALTVAVTVALTGAAQAAVTIPESCPEGGERQLRPDDEGR